MSVFKLNSRHLREVLIFCFHLNKTAAEAHRMLSSTYGEAALGERTCREWFQRLKSGDFDFKDRHGGGKENIFEGPEFEELLGWRLVPNARRISRVMGSHSTSHFETPRSHGNNSGARKLGCVRLEAEKCWTAFLWLSTDASKTESEEVFTLQCDHRRKMGPLR